MTWSKDRSIITLATGSGYFFGFLTTSPSFSTASDTNACLLSGQTEISAVDSEKNSTEAEKTNDKENITQDHIALMNDLTI
jgi:hypothetical protein